MSLRRTGIARKYELRRTGELARTPLARGKGLKTRRVAASRPRDTGPTPAQRAAVLDRAQGCCELCGVQLHDGIVFIRAHSVHHRLARQMGGRTVDWVNYPSNLLLLCGSATTPGGCHARVEADRTVAYLHGWLVHNGQDPAATPVDIGWAQIPVFLTADGDYQEVDG